MTFDTTKFIRTVIAYLPEGRAWVLLALMFGGGLDAATALLGPLLQNIAWIAVGAMNFSRWCFLAGLVTAPFYWPIWLISRKSPEGRKQRAMMLYVDLLEKAAVALNLPKARANQIKERFLTQLADALVSGGTVPLVNLEEAAAKSQRPAS
jgi:hypothetical protein